MTALSGDVAMTDKPAGDEFTTIEVFAFRHDNFLYLVWSKVDFCCAGSLTISCQLQR
jgi:hypothetical protein